MEFSKDQKIIIWIMVCLIIVTLGLETDSFYNRLNSVTPVLTRFRVYGMELIKHENELNGNGEFIRESWRGPLRSLHFLLMLGDYKIELIIAFTLIGFTIIITRKKKNRLNGKKE